MRPALLEVGFRPFYLLAAGFAAAAVPFWRFGPEDALLAGSYLQGVAWHAHEMVFGFAAAVLTGFLLTAARSWTGLATLAGAPLAALAGLWVGGRVLVATGPGATAAVVDCLFLPCAALAVAVPVIRARNWRNLPVLALLLMLAAANPLFHLAHGGAVRAPALDGALLPALDLFALLVALMAGRVIPAFTANAVAGARPRRHWLVETVCFAALGLLASGWAAAFWLPMDSGLFAIVAALGAVAHAVRLWLWDPAATRREPLLWALPLSYAWLPVSLALRALWLAGVDLPAPSPVHALGLGTMGGLMLAMMTRSALGHTGRPLAAGGAETTAFLLLHGGAALRVFGPWLAPAWGGLATDVAAVLWPAAFAVFFVAYWPVLTRPRVDRAAPVRR